MSVECQDVDIMSTGFQIVDIVDIMSTQRLVVDIMLTVGNVNNFYAGDTAGSKTETFVLLV